MKKKWAFLLFIICILSTAVFIVMGQSVILAGYKIVFYWLSAVLALGSLIFFQLVTKSNP